MKKLLSLLMCGLLLFGCSKEYDDSEIKKRLDNLENVRIPSIESQIAAIQTSLPLLQQVDTEIKGYITTLQGKVSALEQSMSGVDVKIKALEYTLQTDFSQRLADVVSQLNAYKQEIQNKIDSFNSSIESLQSADTELEKKISYLDGKIDMQKDWVTATFATLTQYNGLVADIATIRTNIETINKSITDLETRLNEKIETDIATAVAGLQEEIGQKVTEIIDAYTAAIGTAKNEITAAYTSAISSAIDNCMGIMKDWVNEKLANYYNIAVIDAKVQLLQNAISQGDAALDEKLRNEITTVNKSIENAKSELTAAYENAIKTAIETNNGVIDNKIAQKITTVNNRIDTEVQTLVTRIENIETRLSFLENKVEDIDTDVAALLRRIQSISYIPRYDNGQAIMKKIIGQDEGFAELDFMISPKDAVSELAKVWNDAVTMKAVYTQTRAVSFVELPIINFEADVDNGVITLKISGENLNTDYYSSDISANVALFISDGNNNIVSEYIQLIADVYGDYTIYYTTNDGKVISNPHIADSSIFWGKVIANSYANGQGKLIFRDNGQLEISGYTFYNCTTLTTVIIPEGITLIGNFAFHGCSNLESITFPKSTKEIQHSIFSYCDNLISIYCKANTPPIINSGVALAGPPTTIYVPMEFVDDYKKSWASYLASLIVGYNF